MPRPSLLRALHGAVPVSRRAITALLLLASVPPAGAPAHAQEQPRPHVNAVVPPRSFAAAVARGTRTNSGEPGTRYWQQGAEYRLDARLDPATGRVTSTGQFRYFNRSPDTLRVLALHLDQNLYRPGSTRTIAGPVTDGMRLVSLSLPGVKLDSVDAGGTAPGFWIATTILWVRLPTALAPGQQTVLDAAWSFTLPGVGDIRFGSDGNVFFTAYWYPRFAVYDDVSGWQTDPFLGRGEFYSGYANYELSVSVPAGFQVAATGTLRNAREILTPAVLERLALARTSDTVVHIVTAAEARTTGATRPAVGNVIWRFSAQNVRDVSWGASHSWVWDATRAIVAAPDGTARRDTVAIHALYRPEQSTYANAARFERHAIEWLSRQVRPYPYPQMTVAEGLIGGGMEYPMITLLGGQSDSTQLYEGTHHETAHMWFPIVVGSDERRYGWQDEGFANLLSADGLEAWWGDRQFSERSRNAYLAMARTEGERELMRPHDEYPTTARVASVATYDKSLTAWRMLRAVIGDSVFWTALRQYANTWAFKHPQPWDLFNTFSRVSGKNLDWFWRTWWYERWVLDQAVGAVRRDASGTTIVIEDRGEAPMPVPLTITRRDGHVERRLLPVDAWLAGKRTQTVKVPPGSPVVRVEIDADHAFADMERANNVWEASAAAPASRSTLPTGARRSMPPPVEEPAAFAQAVARGFRTRTGTPGSAYWSNYARYDLAAVYEPDSARLTGSMRARYLNRSPDTLRVLKLHLEQNVHAPGAVRNMPAEETGGVQLLHVSLAAQTVPKAPPSPNRTSYQIEGTVLAITPARPLLPGDSMAVEAQWTFRVPRMGAGSRMGRRGSDAVVMAYWFPRFAVYDDMRGWDAETFLGASEPYYEWGDYNVSITVPGQWIVNGTGTLQNANEVLSVQSRDRLQLARRVDTLVHVATSADRKAGLATARINGTAQWRFTATRVPDFTWMASADQQWDATSVALPVDADGAATAPGRVLVHALYRPGLGHWNRAAEFARFALAHHTRMDGLRYPWPELTLVEADGVINGAMEFAMAVAAKGYEGAEAEEQFEEISHEVAHQWVPMVVGTNQRRAPWMDEGFSVFHDNTAENAFEPGINHDSLSQANYFRAVRAGIEVEMRRHGDLFPADNNSRTVASYQKPAYLLYALVELLGEPTFWSAYRAFLHQWKFKHPVPSDFFNAFDRAAGTSLAWLWGTWYATTWTMDHRIAGVRSERGRRVLRVEDRGGMPMPVTARLTWGDGSTSEVRASVDAWLAGATWQDVPLPATGTLTRVELDPRHRFPDVDRSNDVWTAH